MANVAGATFGPEPVATLTVSPLELTLTGPLGTYRWRKGTVQKITRGSMYPWFFRAVRIVGTEDTELQFKPLHVSHTEIIQRLHKLGYGS